MSGANIHESTNELYGGGDTDGIAVAIQASDAIASCTTHQFA